MRECLVMDGSRFLSSGRGGMEGCHLMAGSHLGPVIERRIRPRRSDLSVDTDEFRFGLIEGP